MNQSSLGTIKVIDKKQYMLVWFNLYWAAYENVQNPIDIKLILRKEEEGEQNASV